MLRLLYCHWFGLENCLHIIYCYLFIYYFPVIFAVKGKLSYLDQLSLAFFFFFLKSIITCDSGLDFVRSVTCQSSSLPSEGHLNPTRQYGHVLSNLSRIIFVKDRLVFCHRSKEISETVLIFNHISTGMFYGVTK